jgi:hypothetical protein
LNGIRLSAPTSLSAGDVIEVGGVALLFRPWLDELETVTQTETAADRSPARFD